MGAMRPFRWFVAPGALALLMTTMQRAEAGCPIPGFTNAAFSNSSFNSNGTTDSWDSTSGAYNPATACTDATSCNDTNACSAGIGTNASSFGSTPTTAGSCTTSAGVTLPNPTVPSIPVANQLGAISGSSTITGPGNFSATSISESGTSALNVNTASPNGPVVLYVSGSITLAGNGAINNDSLNPSKLLIMCTGGPGQSITLNGNGNAYLAVYCPQADIIFHGGGSGGQIWGAIVGNTITGSGSHAMTVHYDKQLANLLTSAISCGDASRSAPTFSTITSSSCTAGTSCPALVQGTFVAGTQTTFAGHSGVAAWTFPYITGHLRAREADGTAAISTTATSFATGTILFDAAASTKIPVRSDSCSFSSVNGLNGSCRMVFTNTNSTASTGGTAFPRTNPGSQPNVTVWNDTTAVSTIGPLIAPNASYGGAMVSGDYTTISHTVLGTTSSPNTASLGGIDRSTAAVIPASAYTSSASRPTIVYVGGTDGMLHAICGQPGGTTVSQTTSVCPSAGTELWAFAPRQQLPLLPSNSQRVDGSVHVIDAYGDFTTMTGTSSKSWKTILVFQTGFSKAAAAPAAAAYGATYALDVTDPAAPVVLWEYTVHSTVAASDFGAGMTVSVGPVLVGGQQRYLAVVETNDGGTSASTAPGAIVTAIYLDTGVQAWQVAKSYATSSVPYQAIPGGAVGVDLTGNGFFTDYVFGDLFGQVWRVAAADGRNQTGSSTTPLFKFTYTAGSLVRPIGAPPAIYSDGSTQYVAVASGGYADQADAATTWFAGPQYFAAVKLNASSPPVLDTATPCNNSSCDLRLLSALDVGTKAYSQPLVVGNQLFVTSESVDVNSASYGSSGTATGHVLAINGLNGTASATSYSTSTVYGGASSLVAGSVGGSMVIYAGSSDKQVKLGTAATSSAGTGVALSGGSLGAGTAVTVNVAKVSRLLWLRTQ